jgi:hypothetical protein
VRRDPNLPLTLLDQKGAGKHLVLITNSDWNYTKQMMKYICDEYLPEGACAPTAHEARVRARAGAVEVGARGVAGSNPGVPRVCRNADDRGGRNARARARARKQLVRMLNGPLPSPGPALPPCA